MSLSFERAEEIVDDCHESLEALLIELRHAIDYAQGRRDTRSSHRDQTKELDGERQERVATSGRSDPTGETAIDNMKARRIVRQVGGRLQALPTTLNSIRSHLDKAFPGEDDDYEPLRRAVIPSKQDKAKHDEATNTRQKREMLERAERLENRARALRRRAKEIA